MDPLLGSIQLFAFNYAPINWALCDGSLIQIGHNTALYSLLGPTYGGDGMSTFALPNLKGKEPVPGSVYCICVAGAYPSRP
nr:tail fiber protein [Variovorax sp. dw_954]